MKHILRIYSSIFVSASVVFLLTPICALAYLAAPVALTDAPTFVTENSAQVNGKVNANEMPDTYQWFEWGVVGRAETVYETPHRSISTGNRLSNVNAKLTGLAPNMQYFYRQVAENGRGKDVGMTTYFTTKSLPVVVVPLVIVQTSAPTAITEVSAELKGYFSPHGNTNAQWWFEWGLSSRLENKTPISRSWNANSGAVSTKISGLTPGTTYFYRIVGENDLGQVYGATRVFVTHGTLPVTISETPRNQAVQNPTSGDNVSRVVTTSGTQSGSSVQTASSGAFPGSNAGDIIASLFGKKKTTTSGAPASTTPQNGVAATTQVAGVGAATPVGVFWNSLTGKKAVEVVIEKIGPKKVPAHTPVEYQIMYAYRLDTSSTDGRLKIVLPENVVYIGDNTENELLLEESEGPERTYVLPVGRLEAGSTRTISILGMTTGAANGTFPDARARLEYVNANNILQVVSAGQAVNAPSQTASVGGGTLLPSSFFGWIIYLLLVIGLIISLRKAKVYYLKRKEEIKKEEEAAARAKTFSGTPTNGEVLA